MKLLVISIVLLSLTLCGCRHTKPVAPVTEYGTSGPEKIVILIVGGVERPGRYYVDDGATLATISNLFGGLRSCETCGFTPSKVIVSPQGHPEQRQRYLLSRTNDLQMVRLSNGDTVIYPTIHF